MSVPRRTYALVTIAFFVVFASSSIKGVYQAYFADLAQHFGEGRSRFAWSGSLFMLVTGFMSPVVGALSDRVGPMRTASVGALCAGAAYLAIAHWNDSLWLFTVAFGVLGAFGLAAMTFVPMGVLVDRLFEERKKGLAYAVITNGTAIGFIVLSPLWIWAQSALAWQLVFSTVGAILVLAVAVPSWLAARLEPQRSTDAETTWAGSRWRAVSLDPAFYVLALGFFGCGATMAFIDVHLLAYWQGIGASRLSMSYGLGTLGVLELLSGLLAGWLALRWSKWWLLAGFYAMRSISMLLLLAPGLQILPFATMFGASYLGTVIITSMFCFERYGARIKGRVFGLLFLCHQLGAFASVQLGAVSFDRIQGYEETIVVLSLLTGIAAVANLVILRWAKSPIEVKPA